MNMNFKVSVSIGPRTQRAVVVTPTAVNEKQTTLANEAVISDREIAIWIQDELTCMLDEIIAADG